MKYNFINIEKECILPSPIQTLKLDILAKAQVSLDVKKEYEIHPEFGGNKWRKLKYNLKYAILHNYAGIITFGGAFSNHLHATAAACKAIGIPSVGYVRGEIDTNNPTLIWCKEKGMVLKSIRRNKYREKDSEGFLTELRTQFPNHYVIPEGGTNTLAIKGVAELSAEIESDDYDLICVSGGTGGTATGIIRGITDKGPEVLVFSALKGDFLKGEITKWLEGEKYPWQLITNYHFGGYARVTPELQEFITNFEEKTQIPLDPVYNSKMFFGILDMVSKGDIKKGSRILAIHTGGLQGKEGYPYLQNKLKAKQ